MDRLNGSDCAKTDAEGGSAAPVARQAAVRCAGADFVLTAAELGLWLFGYGHATSYFIEAPNDQYYSNPKYSWPFFGPKLSRAPLPIVLSRDRPAGTYRIFVFGGSAAAGYPNEAFSFSRILEAMLRDRYPRTRFEVINTAVTATNSHVVRATVADCREFDADLYVVYMGHNEIVGPYGPGSVFGRFASSLGAIRATMTIRSTRVGQLMYGAVRLVRGSGSSKRSWGGDADVPAAPRGGGRSTPGRGV